MDAPHLVLTTMGSEESAATLAKLLVEKRLAACVNIVSSVRSIYRWQGDVCDDVELLLIIKTTRLEEVREAIVELHPYDLPELVVLRPDQVDERYARWIAESCAP
jgi:periplasmic divalent cation tolerance protein